MTIREHKGRLEGLKLCYIGDGNNMANSLIVGGLKCGMTVSVACPEGYRPGPCRFWTLPSSIRGMLQCTADILGRPPRTPTSSYTDVWASMGQEGESSQRKPAFDGLSGQRRS